jgi:hypothetical protein
MTLLESAEAICLLTASFSAAYLFSDVIALLLLFSLSSKDPRELAAGTAIFDMEVVPSGNDISSSACQLIASSLLTESASYLMLESRGSECRRWPGISRLYCCFSSGEGDLG